jgi:hypothetical protein
MRTASVLSHNPPLYPILRLRPQPVQQQRELLTLSAKTVESLGFQCGVFHVEGKYTSRGARLIEVNCRMGGGPVRWVPSPHPN